MVVGFFGWLKGCGYVGVFSGVDLVDGCQADYGGEENDTCLCLEFWMGRVVSSV